MDDWLFIILISTGLFVFLALILWLDWVSKCRKSAKDNNLKNYLSGFLVFRMDEDKNKLIVLDGILGVNATQFNERE